MAKPQHCMEIRMKKGDICMTELEGDEYRISFKSPQGASKFCIVMSKYQAFHIADTVMHDYQAGKLDPDQRGGKK